MIFFVKTYNACKVAARNYKTFGLFNFLLFDEFEEIAFFWYFR